MPAAPSARPALALAVAALLALLLPACDGGGTDEAEFGDDLVGRFEARDRYVPLADALDLTSLDDVLRTGGPYTVLAPTRTAFAYVGTDFSPVLFAEPQRETLARVLRHHVVAGRLAPEDFADGATLTAIDGTTLRVRRIGPIVTVNGVTVDLDDPTEASNGVAYPLADILFDVLATTERLRLSPLLSTFAGATRSTGVQAQADALDRVTVLAPTNDAFDALGGGAALLLSPTNVEALRRSARAQILPGDVDLAALVGQAVTTLGGDQLSVTQDAETGVLFVDGIRVLHQETTADGRLYLLAEPVLSVLSLDERVRIRPDLTRYEGDLAGVPAVRARLRDRAAALTVFAPSNFVYSARPAELVAILAEPNQAALVRRLTTVRVVEGRYTRADLVDGLQLTTLEGTVLTVQRSGDTIVIDGRVLGSAEPARAANGLLYTADIAVFPNLGLIDTIILTNRFKFFRAVQRAGLEATFRTTVRTAFVTPEARVPGIIDRPDLAVILRRTATTAFLPSLPDLVLPTPFTALNGEARSVVAFDCTPPEGEDPDLDCSRFAFESRFEEVPGEPEPVEVFGTQIYPGGPTTDGTAAIHELRGIDEPPEAPRAGRR